MIRAGIIGAGTMGTAHAESIARLANVHLTAVADPNLQRAQELAQAYGALAVKEPADVIGRSDIEAVIIASPTNLHAKQARNAIEAGKHIFLEIPVVRNLREADELLAAASASDRVITAGHLQRFFSEYQMLRQQVKEGATGKPVMIRLGRRTAHPRGWYADIEASGGVVLDAMVHEFDFLRWCCGPVERIFCRSLQTHQNTDILDYALAVLRLESGAIAHIESSWSHYGQFSLDVEIAGDKGLVHYSNQESVPLHLSLIDIDANGQRYFAESPISEPAHYKLIQQFFLAVEGKADNPVPLSEGIEAARLALAAVVSYRTNHPVKVKKLKAEVGQGEVR